MRDVLPKSIGHDTAQLVAPGCDRHHDVGREPQILWKAWDRQHAVVSRTNTLMEILAQNNALQRFGLGLRLGSQTQTIS